MRSVSKLARARRRSRRRILAFSGVGAGLTVGVLAAAVVGVPLSAPNASGPAILSSPAGAVTAVSGAAIDSLRTSEVDAQGKLSAGQSALDAARQMNATVVASGLDLGEEATVETAALEHSIDDLTATVMPLLLFPELTADVERDTRDVVSATEQLQGALDSAVAAKAAEEAAAAAAAEAQRQAEAAAAALASANTPEGARSTARAMAAERYGWDEGQFSCLESLWQKESGWNYQAYNASSGATGIPQALPGEKMSAAGADWQTNAATQIAWGLDYIDRAYGTPCSAWGHSQATNWY
jgi:hypothetical protein